jgi:hypothetical protein
LEAPGVRRIVACERLPPAPTLAARRRVAAVPGVGEDVRAAAEPDTEAAVAFRELLDVEDDGSPEEPLPAPPEVPPDVSPPEDPPPEPPPEEPPPVGVSVEPLLGELGVETVT